MNITVFRDLKKFVLTSTLTVDTIELVKKYRPDALKIKDTDGNDVFAVSYCKDRPNISALGVTFGSKSAEGGFAQIAGDLPEKLNAGMTYGDFVADKVGAALEHINALEASIPAVAAEITTARETLIGSIEEV